MQPKTFKDALANWTDCDIAAFALARSIGLMGIKVDFATDAKHVFWATHPIGSLLHKILNDLVEVEVLENRDGSYGQYRWNRNFIGSWETAIEQKTF